MTLARNIYLIGPMGSGKTSVGKQLARLTGAHFYDSDQEIERRTGVSVAWIFEKEKECGFRRREADIIAELTRLTSIVLATGGGSILLPENRKHLKSTGTIVYLTVALEAQLTRTQRRQGTRPLLSTPNPEKKLLALNKERDPLYRALADIVCDTDGVSPLEIAAFILEQAGEQHENGDSQA